jgi:hypothetical protein
MHRSLIPESRHQVSLVLIPPPSPLPRMYGETSLIVNQLVGRLRYITYPPQCDSITSERQKESKKLLIAVSVAVQPCSERTSNKRLGYKRRAEPSKFFQVGRVFAPVLGVDGAKAF